MPVNALRYFDAGMTALSTAYLIMAHRQPSHLAKLIEKLDSSTCMFFIHIDAKVDDSAFKQLLLAQKNIVFIDHRHTVTWAGFSQVEATLALVHAALSFYAPFHRFCLLSGADFPLKSNSHIAAEFSSAKEFLRVDRKIGASEDNSHSRKVCFYWYIDAANKARSGTGPRKPYNKIALYQGAQWWALTRECIEYILQFLAANPRYLSFFKYVHSPDEIFFHSIVKDSPFASRITHDFERAADFVEYLRSNEHGCHYIDWNATGEPRLPKVLDLADLESLLDCEALFARKFDNARSAELIAALEGTLAR